MRIVNLLRDRRGIETTEIALALALIVVAAIGVMRLLGVNITATLQRVANAIGG